MSTKANSVKVVATETQNFEGLVSENETTVVVAKKATKKMNVADATIVEMETKPVIVESVDETVIETQQPVESITEQVTGQETAEEKHKRTYNKKSVDFSSIESLDKHEPNFNESENLDSRYDEKVEKSIQEGIAVAEKLGIKINQHFLRAAKWFRIKPSRDVCKNAINNAAFESNKTTETFFNENMDFFRELESLAFLAVRLNQMSDYFKPKGETPDSYKLFDIDGKTYNVSIKTIEKARKQFPNDHDKIKAYIAKNSEQRLIEVFE